MAVPSNVRYVQGVSQIGADQLNTFVQGCNTAAQLRGFIGIPGMSIHLLGLLAPNDGGAGLFQWNSSAGGDDGTNIIVPHGVISGAWVRDISNIGTSQFFSTLALAISTRIANNTSVVFTLGYSAPGDYGGAMYKRVSAAPPHQFFFQNAVDGSFWEGVNSDIDPRMLGAKANVWTFGDGTVSAGNLSQIVLSSTTSLPPGAIPGAPIVIWDFAFAHALVSTTIASVVQPNIINLTAPASTSGSALTGYFGSDDTVAIANAITASGYTTPANTSTPPNQQRLLHSGGNGWFQQGTRRVVFRTQDRPTSMYGVASPIFRTSGTALRCEEGAQIIALPNFSGDAVVSQAMVAGAPYLISDTVCDNLQINGMGIAPLCAIWYFEQRPAIKNGMRALGGLNGGIQYGPGVNSYSGLVQDGSADGRIYIEAISTTQPGYVNNAAGIGFNVALHGGDSDFSCAIDCVGYRVGFQDLGSDNQFNGSIHCWTDTNHGNMSPSHILFSAHSHYQHLYSDSPWAPAGTTTIGVLNQGQANIDGLDGVLGNGGTTPPDNTAILFSNQIHSTTTTCRVARITALANSSSRKWATLVDVSGSTFPPSVHIDSISGDGNWYDTGFTSRFGLCDEAELGNSLSLNSLLTQYAKNIAGGSTSALWTPAELAPQIAWWFDASQPASMVLDSSAGVSRWNSRVGKAYAAQTLPATALPTLTTRPTYAAGGWTLGTGYQGVAGGVTFDGVTQLLWVLNNLFPATTDVNIFAVFLAAAQTASSSSIHTLCQVSNDGLWAASPSIVFSTNNIQFKTNGQGGPSVNITNGNKVLMTGIFSSSSITPGSTGRINGAASNLGSPGALGSATTQPSAIGGLPASAGFNCAMTLAEILVFFNPLTDGNTSTTQTRLVEGYLAWKWGIQTNLPGGHPFSGAAPTA